MTSKQLSHRPDEAPLRDDRCKQAREPRGSITGWVTLGVGAGAGVVALVHPGADYVAANSPDWFVLAGILLAVTTRLLARTTGAHYTGLLIATALLLPTACTLSILHLLRAVGAIPFPLDPVSAGVSGGAAVALIGLWFFPSPLRDLRLPVPVWVPVVGIAASLLYPMLKTLWAVGIDIAAPAGALGVLDATFVVTVALSLATAPALAIALRWWDRPAPRWMRPVALVGGLILLSLGLSGLWAGPADATGVLVYGGWLVWGAATLATAGRLSPRPVAAFSTLDR